MDPLIMYALWRATAGWDQTVRLSIWWAHFAFVFAFTKTVKLWGLFRRHPSDVAYLPLSIVFGWFHGLIKLYALATLNMVSPILCAYDYRLDSDNELFYLDFMGQPTRW